MVVVALLAGNLFLTVVILALFMKIRAQVGEAAANAIEPLAGQIDSAQNALEVKFGAATTDMAERLERTKGDLRQETADRLAAGFRDLYESIGGQLSSGREEQAATLKLEIQALTNQTRSSLDAIRAEVDRKLLAISDQVSQKLDQNIKEGFKQFEKVQEHLKAAEEQLRNVSTVGNSINDLNNLLKLPHLRGRFGEASLERLLADFLPASMYALQAAPGTNGQGRADAIIK